MHNAIEFGMVQAIAEGVEMLRGFDHELDLPGLLHHWNHGSVIRSWLVELMGHALAEGGIGPEPDVPPDPSSISTYVEDTDEVKWVIQWAMDRDIPTPVTGMSQQYAHGLPRARLARGQERRAAAEPVRRPRHPPRRRRPAPTLSRPIVETPVRDRS
ncbi:MAG: hypothetical protein M3520_06470 [Actinomycetota bacterium]|nr:hypothetical protein [Actinomycetota bacterium]